MEDSASLNPSPILLGRPFLKTAKMKIDVHDGTLSMEFDDKVVKFNLFDAMKHPRDDQSVFSLDTVETLVVESLDFQNKNKKDKLEVVLSQALQESKIGIQLDEEVEETIMEL